MSFVQDAELDFAEAPQPGKTYKLQISKGIIIGKTQSDIEALKQAIYKILHTERFENIIYSWNYGIELQDLFGMPLAYVQSELKRRIPEALTQDDRINSVDSFSFEQPSKSILAVTFLVHSIYGDLQEKAEVNYT